MAINSEESYIIKKLNDKASQAIYNNYPTYTQFLDLYEQSLFLSHLKTFPGVKHCFSGGYEDSERKIIGFYSSDYASQDLIFPIIALRISCEHASERLTHRDYLGAIMSLGIERFMIGDIICNANEAFVFCIDHIADYIIDHLISVRNTYITVSKVETSNFEIKPEFDIIKGTVSSMRLDSIIKLGFSMSRGNALSLIEGGKAYINSRLYEKASTKINSGDIISIRGFGKIRVNSIGEMTKKGRIFIELYKYK